MLRKSQIAVAAMTLAITAVQAADVSKAGAQMKTGAAARPYAAPNLPDVKLFSEEANKLRDKLRERFPKTTITSINSTPLPGIYELIIGNSAAFTDKEANFFIFGHLFDMNKQVDMTAERISMLSREETSQFPLQNAIKKVQGNGERTLYVFSDVDCPFCRKLEPELAKLENVTIYTFPYPIDGLHPEAKRKSESIWCAADRAKAWDTYMKNGAIESPGATCENPIASNVALGAKLGIRGTPTVFTGSGKKVVGFQDAESLARLLEQDQAK